MPDHGHFADRLPAAGAADPSDRVIDGQRAVRRGKWKLVLNQIGYVGTAAGNKPLERDDATLLSDLEEDPGERRNLRRTRPAAADEPASAVHRRFEAVTANGFRGRMGWDAIPAYAAAVCRRLPQRSVACWRDRPC